MRLRYTKAAMHDLELIETYITDVLLAPESAQAIVGGLVARIARLAELPDMGLSVAKRFHLDLPDRCVIFDKYIVIYRVDAEDDVVSIGRILDTRTNYMALLLRLPSPYD